MLNVLVILATAGAALMVFDQVRAFGASLLTSAGILGLVTGIAAQRTLQNVFGFQPSNFARISPTIFGLAFPFESFITCPLRKLIAAPFPLLKSSTDLGFAAIT